MRIEGFKKPVDRVISFLLILLMVGLVLCVVWQVTSRYILQQPSTMTDELARFLMIWVGLLGAAYVVGQKKHLAIDLLVSLLPARKRHLLDAFINLLIVVFALGVVTFGGIGLVERVLASNQMSSGLQIRMGYVYLILPLSGLIMAYYSLLYLIESASKWHQAEKNAPTIDTNVSGD